MSETTTDRAPWCPRCGNAPLELYGYCPACNFNAEYSDSCWRAAGPWTQAVRAELARQALEMRAHASASETADWGQYCLPQMMKIVMTDYNGLGAHPLRLPGEGKV